MEGFLTRFEVGERFLLFEKDSKFYFSHVEMVTVFSSLLAPQMRRISKVYLFFLCQGRGLLAAQLFSASTDL